MTSARGGNAWELSDKLMNIKKTYLLAVVALVSIVVIAIGVWIVSFSVADPEPPSSVNRERMNFGTETKGLANLNETVIVKR
jgi:hypothetical protein